MKGKAFFIIFAAALTLIFTTGLASAADDYPSKPVSFLIPFGAGGSADLMGRALATGTENSFGQAIVPINRPGAGGGIMYTALKNSPTDGYTVGWNSTSILTSTNIGNVPFKYTAFAQVCRVGFYGHADRGPQRLGLEYLSGICGLCQEKSDENQNRQRRHGKRDALDRCVNGKDHRYKSRPCSPGSQTTGAELTGRRG